MGLHSLVSVFIQTDDKSEKRCQVQEFILGPSSRARKRRFGRTIGVDINE
ncbi:MAG: hypothetical protein PHG79_10130 [Methanosarcina sp.]|nr:hypothetical protein [Methanosarcina sp.]